MLDFAISWDLREGRAAISHTPGRHPIRQSFSAAFPEMGLSVAGNWRPDNRAQLAARLHLPADASPALIIATGYRAWQSDIAAALQGPFAFGLFDHKANRLFGARDAFGVEPLFLAQTPATIALSNTPTLARRQARLSSTPEPAMIADFLRGNFHSETRTFHQGMRRVRRGHWLQCDPQGQTDEQPFYDLTAVPASPPGDDAVGHFRHLFDTSVAQCGGNQDNVGALLSGGLDSSAVAASIAHHRTHAQTPKTYSMLYDGDTFWPDRPYVYAMRGALDMDHHGRDLTHGDPMENIPHALAALDGPSLANGLSNLQHLYALARDQGVQTLFDGHGGDEVVSYGIGRLSELFRQHDWLTLWRESEGAAGLWATPRARVFAFYILRTHKLRGLRRILPERFMRSTARVLPDDDLGQLIAPDLARSCPEPDDLPRPPGLGVRTDRDLQEHALLQPMQPHALETLTLTARSYGLDLAIPFFSRDLIEFSVGLPSHWKLRGGFTRYILRESMRGRVPDLIADRRDKNDFAGNFIRNVFRSEAINDLTRNPSAALREYVNAKRLNEIWAKVEQDHDNVSIYDARGLWFAGCLAMWLDSDRDACLRA